MTYLDMTPADDAAVEALKTLKQRSVWLTHRIQAKKDIGWDFEWDTKERDSLNVIIEYVEDLLYS